MTAEPFLSWHEDATRELFVSLTEKLPDAARALHVWVSCRDEAGRTLSELGVNLVNTFLRLDLSDIGNVEERPLPGDLRIIHADDPRADQAAWLGLYNRSFEGEWLHLPEELGSWTHRIARNPHLSLAAIDEANQVVSLVLAQLEDHPSDDRAQPIGNVLVICTDERRRRQRIADAMLREILVRLRVSGAGCATIRADLASQHQSHRLYEQVGFQRAVDFCIWEYPAAH